MKRPAFIASISLRILRVDFTRNPATTLLVHYSSVEGNSEADEHYSLLSDSIKECPNHNIVLVIGDCNAHIGNEAAKYTYHQETNHNEALIKLSQENHLMIANTCFQKKSGKLWTYLSDRGEKKSQLDYILINKKWKNSIKNVEEYSSFASIGSDHRVISARLKLSLRKVKTPTQNRLYNWSALSNNEELQHQYTIQIRNRYAELCSEGEDITEKYDKPIKANNETAHFFKQENTKTRQTSQIMKRLLKKDIKFQKAFDLYRREANETTSENLQSEKAKLYRIYNSLCEEQVTQQITLIETAAKRGQCSKCWNLIMMQVVVEAPKKVFSKARTKVKGSEAGTII